MPSPKRVVIDTNLLVRYLTQDDSEKADAVESLLDKAGSGEVTILIPSIVIAELVWVLESFYKLEAVEVSELVESILNTPGLEVNEKEILLTICKTYREKKIDFIDAWIMEFAKKNSIDTIYSFDKKHFKGLKDVVVRQP